MSLTIPQFLKSHSDPFYLCTLRPGYLTGISLSPCPLWRQWVLSLLVSLSLGVRLTLCMLQHLCQGPGYDRGSVSVYHIELSPPAPPTRGLREPATGADWTRLGKLPPPLGWSGSSETKPQTGPIAKAAASGTRREKAGDSVVLSAGRWRTGA